MTSPHESPLGKAAGYPDRYDPSVLFAMPRAPQRSALGIGEPLPFHGADIWNAYELSWLDARGRPEIALAELRFPATTPNIVESKSLKLYLGGFHQERLRDADALRARVARDLSSAAGGEVEVALLEASRLGDVRIEEPRGESIDALAVDIESYGPPNADYLETSGGDRDESLVSNLLKTNCPVTGQPDWAAIEIRYAGPCIRREGLLRYLVSYRQHADFHEHCVERIYMDILRRCAPRRLFVHARYTRRGGLDINPWRASEPGRAQNLRSARQ